MGNAASQEWMPPAGAAVGSRYAAPEPAGWWARVGAALLDSIVVLVTVFVLAFAGGAVVGLSGGDEPDAGAGSTLFTVVFVAAAVLYAPVMLALNHGRTWGKQACGIRVVNRDYAPIGFGRALLRELPAKGILSVIPLIDPLWPLWESEKRALHDLVVATRVVADPSARRGPDWPVIGIGLAFLAIAAVLFAFAIPPELPCTVPSPAFDGDYRECGSGLAPWLVRDIVAAGVAVVCALVALACAIFAVRRPAAD